MSKLGITIPTKARPYSWKASLTGPFVFMVLYSDDWSIKLRGFENDRKKNSYYQLDSFFQQTSELWFNIQLLPESWWVCWTMVLYYRQWKAMGILRNTKVFDCLISWFFFKYHTRTSFDFQSVRSSGCPVRSANLWS